MVDRFDVLAHDDDCIGKVIELLEGGFVIGVGFAIERAEDRESSVDRSKQQAKRDSCHQLPVVFNPCGCCEFDIDVVRLRRRSGQDRRFCLSHERCMAQDNAPSFMAEIECAHLFERIGQQVQVARMEPSEKSNRDGQRIVFQQVDVTGTGENGNERLRRSGLPAQKAMRWWIWHRRIEQPGVCACCRSLAFGQASGISASATGLSQRSAEHAAQHAAAMKGQTKGPDDSKLGMDFRGDDVHGQGSKAEGSPTASTSIAHLFPLVNKNHPLGTDRPSTAAPPFPLEIVNRRKNSVMLPLRTPMELFDDLDRPVFR